MRSCTCSVSSSILALFALTGFAAAGACSALIVPDQTPSVQAALDAGVDTVLVRAGQYSDSPSIYRAVIVLVIPSPNDTRAHFPAFSIAPAFSSGADNFVFDGIAVSGQLTMNNQVASADLSFRNCDLLGGIADVSPYVQTVNMGFSRCALAGGAHLFVINSAAVESCAVDGGVELGGGTIHVVIRASTFSGNGSGGAVMIGLSDTVLLEDNRIAHYAIGASIDADTKAVVQGNHLSDCWYKGLHIEHHDITVQSDTLEACGLGMELTTSHVLEVKDNVLHGCTDTAMSIEAGSDGYIGHNVISGGAADALHVYGTLGGPLTIDQNTIASNAGAGVVWDVNEFSQGAVDLVGNICYQDRGYGVQWRSEAVNRVACNDLFGNTPADVTGRPASSEDIAVEPQFCDPANADYQLLATSPLVNAPGCGQVGALGAGCGVTATLVSRFTADWITDAIWVRWELSDAALSSTVWLERSESAVGPWERPVIELSQAGATEVAVDRAATMDRAYWYRLMRAGETGNEVLAPAIQVAAPGLRFALGRIWPNPASGPIRLEFAIARTAQVFIEIYDLQGRLVATPIKGSWPPGKHEISWDGVKGQKRARAGTYIVRYRYPGGEDRRRFVRLP